MPSPDSKQEMFRESHVRIDVRKLIADIRTQALDMRKPEYGIQCPSQGLMPSAIRQCEAPVVSPAPAQDTFAPHMQELLQLWRTDCWVDKCHCVIYLVFRRGTHKVQDSTPEGGEQL